MTKRINIVLPEATVRTIDRIAKPGERSRFISRAVDHYLATQSTAAVQRRLEAALLRDRDLEQATAAEWSAVDQESWRQLEPEQSPSKPVTRSAAKSTSRRSIRP